MSVGSSGLRLHGINAFTDQQAHETTQHGYLNRKCIIDPNTKKKDRSWQTFWFSLKGSVLEFYKVDGVRAKSQGEPPPKDILPPPKQVKDKVGFLDIDGAIVEVDYTFQENMDIEKRRKHLFRVELQNNTEFMFQAPSDDRRKTWVIALQAASRRKSIGEEESILQSHSIRTSRCSIKQRSAHNVHASISPSFNASASLDDPDYVDFSLAERMVSRDPRLRALKKRLQAKKQLLAQLNKMYTSFLGGNVAALYDDTLLHQQLEPPTINGRQSTKENVDKKVVHRRMSLPDSEANGDTEGTGSNEGDRRASTGDFNVPIITSSVSPGLDSVIEGLETELLEDFYLVPGAEWSLLKKGDTVRVLGKARMDGRWYRCMAHRDTDIKIPDLSLPPPAVVNALLPGTIISQGNNGVAPSQLQQEVMVEESLDDVAMEEAKEGENEGASTEEVDAGEDVFVDDEREREAVESVGSTATTVEDKDKVEKDKEIAREGEAADLSTKSPSEDGGKGSTENVVVRRNQDSQGTTERPLSYMLATEEEPQKIEEEVPPPQTAKERGKTPPSSKEVKQDTRPKRKMGKLSRSTSSPSAGARIRLQQSMGLYSVPGVAQSPVLQSRYSISTSRGGLSASFPPGQGGDQEGEEGGPSRMAKLLESEAQTGSYSCPLVGCIPGSVLKHFANKDETKRFSMSPVSFTSPSMVYPPSATSLSSPSGTPTQLNMPVCQQNGTAEEHVIKELSSTNTRAADHGSSDTGTVRDNTTNEEMSVASRVSITVTGDEEDDVEVVGSPEAARRARMRAHSLPPQLIYTPSPPASPDNDRGEEGEESSLDRSPSHLRRSPGFKTPEPPETGYSQLLEHPPSPSRVHSEGGKRMMGGSSGSISSLFDSGSSKKSIFKKLFGKKSGSKPRSVTDVTDRSGVRSPSPNPPATTSLSSLMLKNVLLGKNVKDEFEPQDRARVSSISGRPVRQDGVGIVIGNESSSESEDEGDDSHEGSLPSSPTHKEEREREPAVKKLEAGRQLSGNLGTSSGQPPISPVNIPRSMSEYGPLSRTKGATSPEMTEEREMMSSEAKDVAKAKSASLKRPSKIRMSFKKTKIKGKKRPASEAYLTESDTGTPMSDITTPNLTRIFRQPPRDEVRMVYLDPSEGKYGFRLQSYGRMHERGKVLQTFVQNVVPGSVSFMAGLYPGDAIVAINGENVKYSAINDIYKAIKEASKGKDRIALQVVFADGVTRLECMRKSDEVKNNMKEKQQRLRELLATERLHSTPPTTPIPSPQHIVLAQDLPSWSETTPQTKPGPRPFPYDRHLNQVVSLHGGSITSLACDVLVMPLSSCFRPQLESENVLFQLLRNGGDELVDELSLARQARVGDIIVTRGHNLNTRNIYHCVFGDLEESLQSCCRRALETAKQKELSNIIFWVDGFASLSVSPHLILEAVRQWLQQGANGSTFERVVFSAKANISLIERHMDDYFPLQTFEFHNRTASELSEATIPKEQGKEVTQEPDKAQDRTENETSKSDRPQNGITQIKTVESKESAHKNDLEGIHKQVSTVSLGAIAFEMGSENGTIHKEPIPEDVEPESDTNSEGAGDVNMDNIELELQGVENEMSNIQSILLEMQEEQKEQIHVAEEEGRMVEDEDPLGLLRFLGNRSQPQEIQNSITSTSLSAHTSPIHQGILSENNLSRSLPFLDIEEGFLSPSKLNPKREESEV